MRSAREQTNKAAQAIVRSCLLTALGLQAGCAAFPANAPISQNTPTHQLAQTTSPNLEIQRASYQDATLPLPNAARLGAPQNAAVSQLKEPMELTADAVVGQVLARNPSLVQMTAAWQAASQRVPQVTSPDDPMFMGVLAPASLGSNQVEAGYRLEVSQKFLFPGKLKLRGQAAWAEASAASNDLEDMRVQLMEGARAAFYDYYLADRASAVNEEGLRLLHEMQKEAQTRYQNGLTPQQDIFQADVEIGRQHERKIILERMRRVSMARINALMHMPTDSPLPPPIQQEWQASSLPPVGALQQRAIEQRADLKALADRIVSEETGLALALREYYPDVEASVAYDTIMGNGPTRDLAAQVALKVNLPVRLKKREAAVHEYQAKVAQKRAELASRLDQVRLQIQEAYEQVRESEQILALYDKSLLPSARANVKAAQAAYLTGKAPFLSLIEAQRNVVGLRDRYYEATAELFRRRATLERSLGSPVLAPDPKTGTGPLEFKGPVPVLG